MDGGNRAAGRVENTETAGWMEGRGIDGEWRILKGRWTVPPPSPIPFLSSAQSFIPPPPPPIKIRQIPPIQLDSFQAMVSNPSSLFLFIPFLLCLLKSSNSIPESSNPFVAANSSSTCAPDSFFCPGQGNCIPADWVGDGEADCEDGADERPKGGNNNNNGTTGLMEAADPFATAPAASFEEWTQQMGQQLPDFFDRPLQSGRLLLQGCPLLPTTAKEDPFQSAWARLQMFLCELLGPALRDQPDCLSTSKNCPMPSIPLNISTSIPCFLLAQSSAHFLCLESQPPAECAESALEMLAPLHQESEHWAQELECQLAPPLLELSAELEEEKRPSAADGRMDSSTAAESIESTTTMKEEEKRTTQPVGEMERGTQMPPPWDALSLLKEAENVCQNQEGAREGELGAPILAKICDRMDVLAENAGGKCFRELEKMEGKKCRQKPIRANSTCDILEGFGRNLDCALRSLGQICPTETQEAVIGIQEQLNDEAIARQCFQQKEGPIPPRASPQFPFLPQHSQCSADQEETALLCLAELADLPSRLQRLPSLGSLLSNQSSLQSVCSLFDHYDGCIQSRVFAKGPKCSLNSPLNALARVGLAPICAHSRSILAGQIPPNCLQSPAISQCQAPVDALGRAVGAILQGGSNGPAQLCKAFYSLRDAFQCGQKAAADSAQCAGQLDALLAMLNSIGREEGCPEAVPPNLDSLLLPPMPSRPPSIPQARPLPQSPPPCAPSLQQQFQQCVQPLSTFQPHPLAVIKQPRLIADACQAFANFSECQSQLAPECVPLWSRGMGGMFEFACGPGHQTFLEIRQCLRRATGRPELRECVLTFSRASPQEACPSSGQLLSCALPQIEEKCGQKAGQFVREYVGRFASALEPNCSIAPKTAQTPQPPTAAFSLGPNCSQQHSQIVQQCAEPIGQLRAQLDAMFQGGLQTLMKNLNGMALLFQQGCSLGVQFRSCLGPLLASECTISSCLLAAGAGICDQPDVGAAIDSNLGCVFRQVSNPDFGQCIRTTLGPLRQLNLTALRAALPQFVDCVEPMVLRECGPVPLNVLRVLGSKSPSDCPLNGPQPFQPPIPQAPPICTQQLRQIRLDCQQNFLLSKYEFVPGFLLNLTKNEELDQFCVDLEEMQKCERETRPCEAEEPYGRPRAMRALGTKICSSKAEFGRQFGCLNAAIQSQPCVAQFDAAELGDQFCEAVNASSRCLAPQIFADCGPDALEFVFSASNEYLAQIVPGAKCQLDAPGLSLQTGCIESQLVAYLECEAALDRFRPRPIAVIGNQSRWDEYCAVADTQFRPCVEKLECRPEPAAGAALFMAEAVCQKEISSRDQRQFGGCLLEVTERAEGRQCLDEFRSVDLLGKEAGPKVCAGIDRLLQCAAKLIHAECGEDALLHIFELYNGWANAFQPGCSLSPPDFGQFTTKMAKVPDVEFSADQKPILTANGSRGDEEREKGEKDERVEEKTTTTTTTETTTTKPIQPVTVSIAANGAGANGTIGTPKRIGNGDAGKGRGIGNYLLWPMIMGAAAFMFLF